MVVEEVVGVVELVDGHLDFVAVLSHRLILHLVSPSQHLVVAIRRKSVLGVQRHLAAWVCAAMLRAAHVCGTGLAGWHEVLLGYTVADPHGGIKLDSVLPQGRRNPVLEVSLLLMIKGRLRNVIIHVYGLRKPLGGPASAGKVGRLSNGGLRMRFKQLSLPQGVLLRPHGVADEDALDDGVVLASPRLVVGIVLDVQGGLDEVAIQVQALGSKTAKFGLNCLRLVQGLEHGTFFELLNLV